MNDIKRLDIYHKKYFERKTSQGCLMIEKENGPDEYIDDLKQDIFERFNKLLEFL